MIGGVSLASSYDTANQQATFGGISLSHDANGNLTAKGPAFYQWDLKNRLVSATTALGFRPSSPTTGTI